MHKCRWYRFFPIFLVGLLLFARLAQAQSSPGGLNSQSIETKTDDNYLEPWQPCLDPDQERIMGPLPEEKHHSSQTVNLPTINKLNSKDETKKAAGAENTGPKSDSLGPSFRKNGGSISQNMGLQVGGNESLLSIRESKQSPGLCSSFLDGYLLKSLQDKKKEEKN